MGVGLLGCKPSRSTTTTCHRGSGLVVVAIPIPMGLFRVAGTWLGLQVEELSLLLVRVDTEISGTQIGMAQVLTRPSCIFHCGRVQHKSGPGIATTQVRGAHGASLVRPARKGRRELRVLKARREFKGRKEIQER